MVKFQDILIKKPNRKDAKSLSMRFRLFLFLILLVITMLAGIVVILIVTGTFTTGLKESNKILKSELHHHSQEIKMQYGTLSLQAVEYAKALSANIEASLNKNNLSFEQLSNNSKLLEEFVANEFDLTYYTLQKSNCSGAFFILDTTVNSSIPNAHYSKSGLYLKNLEPNIINATTPSITILRGFSSVGRSNSIQLHAQWSMEFNIKDSNYYSVPMEVAKEYSTLPLSKLYYWSGPIKLKNTSEEIMVCSVPLRDSNRNIIGVCGLEISAMLFKLSHMPNNINYNRMFCMLSPMDYNYLDITKSMIAGGYCASSISHKDNLLQIKENKNNFTSYYNDTVYLGYHTPIQLYPKESPYVSQTWVSAIMVPKDDIADSILKINLIVVTLLILLVTVGVTISVIFSNKYLKPISQGIEIIKSSEHDDAPKTNVQEIDDLIQFLSHYKKDLYIKAEQEKQKISILEQFVEKTRTLSPAEKNVYNLFIQGLSAQEIADQLFLSINTIKTHNKRIYSKLGVTSKEELLLYISMLKELGVDL